MKVVTMVQGHPEFSRGGAETAAYNLHKGLQEAGCQSIFIAQHDSNSASESYGAIEPHKLEGEYFWYTRCPFNDLNAVDNSASEFSQLVKFLQEIQPDVVHFHHFFKIGSELFALLRRKLPNTRIVLTLHEFLAICGRDGQMIKTTGSLCYQPSRQACTRCLGWSNSRYHIRDDYYRKIFESVDAFVSPSQFLKDRYVNWGLLETEFHVIENAQRNTSRTHVSRSTRDDRYLVLGYFGQINPYKGLSVLLKALTLLPKKYSKRVRLNIYGANLDHQEESFKNEITELISQLSKQVTLRGSYEPEHMGQLFNEINTIVVPSIWWENSPMVIQEAFSHGVPVICSDIGGMKEKVTDGVNGLYASAGDPASLANNICRLVSEDGLLDSLVAGIIKPQGLREIGMAHIRAVYSDNMSKFLEINTNENCISLAN